MNNLLQKQLRKYYRDVRKHLAAKTPNKRIITYSLKTNIENYIAENSVTDITEILEHFGTAEDIAEAYFSEQSHLELTKNLRKLKIFRICASLIIIGMICFFIVFIHELRKGYGVGAEIIIHEETSATH